MDATIAIPPDFRVQAVNDVQKYEIETRDREKYLVQKRKTVRLFNSAIPYILRLLNKNV